LFAAVLVLVFFVCLWALTHAGVWWGGGGGGGVKFLQVYMEALHHLQPYSFSPPFLIYYSLDVLLFIAG